MMESCLTREELLSNLNNGGVKMELLATGNSAQVYDLGDGTICKLFKSGYSHTAVLREIRNAEIMNGHIFENAEIHPAHADGRAGRYCLFHNHRNGSADRSASLYG